MSATSKTKNDKVMRYPQDRQQNATRVLNNIQISRPVTVDIIHNRGGIAWDFRREHDSLLPLAPTLQSSEALWLSRGESN